MELEKLFNLNEEFSLIMKNMPEVVKKSCFIKNYKSGEIISYKGYPLKFFGIISEGATRVINEFENGSSYMIEINEAVDFIGDVTILSEKKCVSVTIKAERDCTIIFFPRALAENWLNTDIEFLKYISKKVAYKLYKSSSKNGMNLFYSSKFLFVEYLIKQGELNDIYTKKSFKILSNRKEMSEEIGMNIKTLNRTITSLKDDKYFTIDKGKLVITDVSIKNCKNLLVNTNL